MTATTSEYNLDEPELPRIRKLDRNAPMRWVSQGLNDLKTSRLNSIILILILILILLRPAWSRLAAMVLVFFLTTAHWFRGAGERFMMMLISCHLSVLSHFVGRCWRDSYSVSACSPSHTSHIGRSRSGPQWAAILDLGRDGPRWAAMLAPLVILGIGFFFIGLIFTLPLAGHASWHAYREAIIED